MAISLSEPRCWTPLHKALLYRYSSGEEAVLARLRTHAKARHRHKAAAEQMAALHSFRHAL